MTERTFKKPEGASADIEFIRASSLAYALEAGEIESGAAVVEGTLVGTLPNPMDSNKTDFRIEKEDGSVVILNGAGNLGYGMSLVNVGDYIQVRYNGKQEIAKGQHKGRLAHNFEVLTAE